MGQDRAEQGRAEQGRGRWEHGGVRYHIDTV